MSRNKNYIKTNRTVGTDAGQVGWQNRPLYIRPEAMYREVKSTANRLMLRKMDAGNADRSNYGGGSAAYRTGNRASGFEMQADWLKKQMDSGR